MVATGVMCEPCLARLCVTKDGNGRVTALSFRDGSGNLVPVPTCARSGSGSGSGSGSAGQVAVPCCVNTIPATLTLTISGGGGSFPMLWDGLGWSTGLVAVSGCGTIDLRLSCVGSSPGGLTFGNTSGSQTCLVAFDAESYSQKCSSLVVSTNGTFTGVSCVCGVTRVFTVVQ